MSRGEHPCTGGGRRTSPRFSACWSPAYRVRRRLESANIEHQQKAQERVKQRMRGRRGKVCDNASERRVTPDRQADELGHRSVHHGALQHWLLPSVILRSIIIHRSVIIALKTTTASTRRLSRLFTSWPSHEGHVLYCNATAQNQNSAQSRPSPYAILQDMVSTNYDRLERLIGDRYII